VLQPSVIYHGIFGSGFFQKLYTREPSFALMVCTSLQFHLFATLPLFVLSAWWIDVLPFALLALTLTLGVCGAASMQASLPRDRMRIWSRPLVALLFFLQPIVRGWARYKRGMLAETRKVSRAHARAGPGPASNPFCFWAHGAERFAFIDELQREFAHIGWEPRLDSGWDSFDMEMATNRWSAAQLTTVHEELSEGRRFFRCRIDTRSSWSSRLLATIVGVASVVAVSIWRESWPWIWFALVSIPLVLLFIAGEEGTQCEEIASAVTVVARRLGFHDWTGELSQTPAAPVRSRSP
jgi:hypothetical protein